MDTIEDKPNCALKCLRNIEDVTQRVHPLKYGMNTIGRGLNNDIVLKNLNVSRTHCHLYVEKNDSNDVAFIVDLGTSNGTIVGNTDLVKDKKHKLNDLDMIALASGDQGVVLQFIKIDRTIALPPLNENVQLSNKRKVLYMENEEPTATLLKMPKLEPLNAVHFVQSVGQHISNNEIVCGPITNECQNQNVFKMPSSNGVVHDSNDETCSRINFNKLECADIYKATTSTSTINSTVQMSIDSNPPNEILAQDTNMLTLIKNIKTEPETLNFMTSSQGTFSKEEDSIVILASSDEEDNVKEGEQNISSNHNNTTDKKIVNTINLPRLDNEIKPVLSDWHNANQMLTSDDEDDLLLEFPNKSKNISVLISSDEHDTDNDCDDNSDDYKCPQIIDPLPMKLRTKGRPPKTLVENESIMKTRAKYQRKTINKKKTELEIAEQNKKIAQERKIKLQKLSKKKDSSASVGNETDLTTNDQFIDKPSTTDVLKKKTRVSRVQPCPIDNDYMNIPSTSRCNQVNYDKKTEFFQLNSTKRKVTFKNLETNVLNFNNSVDKVTSSKYFALFDIVSKICKWNAVWLYEQKLMDETPPLTSHLYKMKGQFDDPLDYSTVMKPLLMYENWSKITEMYNMMINKNPSLEQSIFGKRSTKNSPLFTFSINSVNKQFSTGNPMLKPISEPLWCLKCLGTNLHTTNSAGYPQSGFLCIAVIQSDNFELNATKVKKPTKSRNIFFAYVLSAKKTGIYNNNPQWCVELIVTRKTVNIPSGTSIQLLGIHYIRSELRLFQAINCVAVSSLCNALITPQLHNYLYPTINLKNHNICINDGLNNSQKKAVRMAISICLSTNPNIGLIIGPPGTGKSSVICSIVTTLLKLNSQPKINAKHKILVCAPSNEAVDVLVRRLVEIKNNNTIPIEFSVVRVGGGQKMDPLISNVTLDHLVKQKMDGSFNESDNRGRPSMLTMYSNKKDVEKDILQNIDVIVTTLNSCYSKAMEDAFLASSDKGMPSKCPFTVCIVDEAGQSVEPLNYVPILLGIDKLILVGDDKQLQPVVKSKVAKDHGFGISLFKRLKSWLEHNKNEHQQDSIPVNLLDTQYRMHKEICSFPSKYFYKGVIKTALSVYDRKMLPIHPYLIIEHDSQQDSTGEANMGEANLVVSLVEILLNIDGCQRLSIAVLTPYHKQREQINTLLGIKKISLNVNTIDSFQGSECDILLISTVRTTGIGFLDDTSRLNVALTRAKQSLLVCGNFMSLKGDRVWCNLLDDAKQRKLLKKVSKKNLTNCRALSAIVKR